MGFIDQQMAVKNWTKVTNGLPDGAHVGRIGIDISKSNPDIMYVLIDNQEETKTEREINPDVYSQSTFLEISVRDFMQLDNQKLNQYLRRSVFPSEYDAAKVKADVEAGEYEPKALAEYLGDANSALFDTEIKGAEVYRSNDGGNSWTKVNSYHLMVSTLPMGIISVKLELIQMILKQFMYLVFD